MSATVAATPSHYRYSGNPNGRTARLRWKSIYLLRPRTTSTPIANPSPAGCPSFLQLRGVVRFYPMSNTSPVPLTVSSEVPQLLVPVASALQPVLKGLLRRGLERFATLAKSKSS